MTLEDAIERIARLVGSTIDWLAIERFLPETEDAGFRRSALASSFVATLELARQGKLQLRQDEAFAPLMVKAA